MQLQTTCSLEHFGLKRALFYQCYHFTNLHITYLPTYLPRTSHLPSYILTHQPTYLCTYLPLTSKLPSYIVNFLLLLTYHHTYLPTYILFPTYHPKSLPTYPPTYLPTDLLSTTRYLPTYPSTYQTSCNLPTNYLTFLLTYITNDVK